MEKGRDVLKQIETRRNIWQATMANRFPLLAKIALRLLSLHATSCSAERN